MATSFCLFVKHVTVQEQQVKTLHQATLCDLIPFTKTDRRVCLQFLKSQVAICKNEIKCKCLCTCTFLHCYSFTFCICNMFYTVRYCKLLKKRPTNVPKVHLFSLIYSHLRVSVAIRSSSGCSIKKSTASYNVCIRPIYSF